MEDVSLTLPQAGIIAVVGESGSGKSTLARLLARLITPTSGELLLDGQPVPASSRGRRAYARNVQLVLQDPFSSLNPVHDVRYHLARPLQIHGLGEAGGTLDSAIIRPAGAGGADARPPSSSASTPMSCPAGSGSGWRSPARWPSGHGCCWPTSRSPCSTYRSGSAS